MTTFDRRHSARLVALDRDALYTLIAHERDPILQQFAATTNFADIVLGQPNPGYAMIDGAFIVGGAGVFYVGERRAQCWSLISRMARPRHIVAGVRAMKRYLDRVQADPLFRRIEAYVRADQCWSAFAERAGFAREGLLRKWDAAGRDHFLYARVKEN